MGKENKKTDILFRSALQGEVRANKDSRTVTFIASDSTRDSAGTVLNQDGWNLERFNKNGIIGYQHKVYGGWEDTPNPDNVIGKGKAYVKDHKLMVDVEFEPAEINSLAEKIYQKILFGSLKAVSVGFRPEGKGSWGKGDQAWDGANPTYYYAGQELLEISVVNIPANPNAVKKGDGYVDEELEALRAAAENEAKTAKIEPQADPEPVVDATVELKKMQTLTIARASLHI